MRPESHSSSSERPRGGLTSRRAPADHQPGGAPSAAGRSAGHHVPECLCSHRQGDHRSGGSNFPHPPTYGVCLVPGCGCQHFRDRDNQQEAA